MALIKRICTTQSATRLMAVSVLQFILGFPVFVAGLAIHSVVLEVIGCLLSSLSWCVLGFAVGVDIVLSATAATSSCQVRLAAQEVRSRFDQRSASLGSEFESIPLTPLEHREEEPPLMIF
eukprot:scpid98449/ scgid19946/ 